MRLGALLLLVGGAGCSFVFDSHGSDLPLDGAPPRLDFAARLNRAPVREEGILPGVDGAPWVAMHEGASWRELRLEPPADEIVLAAGRVDLLAGAFYLWTSGSDTTLEVRRVGAATGVTLQLPAGDARLIAAHDGAAFGYFVDSRCGLFRGDGAASRWLPSSTGASYFFDDAGEWLFERGSDGRVVAHSSSEARDLDLGVRPAALQLAADGRALFACGDDGLRRVPMAAAADELLDATRCSEIFFARGDALYYRGDDRLKQIALGQARTLFDLAGHRLLFVAPDDAVAWSTDPADRWAQSAGDGWLRGWRFMERGIEARLSGDGTRLHWKEHAAADVAVGALMSAAIGGASRRLARNVREYEELDDGRILAAANQAFAGAQNRVIVVDERSGRAAWVADSASWFMRIPGSSDVLVDIVGGYQLPEHDLFRVSVSARR